jgi:hypothetical protein
MFCIESFVYAWDNQLAYTLALTDDLTDAQMVTRPGGNMNHAAWILGHVSLYHPATVALLAGKPFADPKLDELFGFAGKGPQDDIACYGSKQKIISHFTEGHEQVAQALLSAPPEAFTGPPSLERWAASYPNVGFMLPDLLLHHESLHIGQLSIWRRAAGLAGVPFPNRVPRAGLIPG